MNVTVEQLLAMIGELTVNNKILTVQLDEAQVKIAQLSPPPPPSPPAE